MGQDAAVPAKHAGMADAGTGANPGNTCLADTGTNANTGLGRPCQPRLRRHSVNTSLGRHTTAINHPVLADAGANTGPVMADAGANANTGSGPVLGFPVMADANTCTINTCLANTGTNASTGLGHICQPRLRRYHRASPSNTGLGRHSTAVHTAAIHTATISHTSLADTSANTNPVMADTGTNASTCSGPVLGLPVMADANTNPGADNTCLANTGTNAGTCLGHICQPRLRRHHRASPSNTGLGRHSTAIHSAAVHTAAIHTAAISHASLADTSPGHASPDDPCMADAGTNPNPGSGPVLGFPVMADATVNPGTNHTGMANTSSGTSPGPSLGLPVMADASTVNPGT